VVVGDAGSEFYRCGERGVLAQFRHQHFLLFLIAHVQKAALLMFSDRLVDALSGWTSRGRFVKRFKRRSGAASRASCASRTATGSTRSANRRMCARCSGCDARHLELDALYDEVKDRTADMNTYLDADSLRRQANTVVRLTVVTIFGLIGTITTGFLGMNLHRRRRRSRCRGACWASSVPCWSCTLALTVYTMVKQAAVGLPRRGVRRGRCMRPGSARR
jgi:hypothetical protein